MSDHFARPINPEQWFRSIRFWVGRGEAGPATTSPERGAGGRPGELPGINLAFFPEILGTRPWPILAGGAGFLVLTDIGRRSEGVVPLGFLALQSGKCPPTYIQQQAMRAIFSRKTPFHPSGKNRPDADLWLRRRRTLDACAVF